MHKPLRRLVAGAALALAVVAALLVATPAWAAGSVTVTFADGLTAADPDYATPITVSGSGFQSIQGGFGGIYVLFGWISGSGWGPSAGGTVGEDYRYVPDSESKDNAGFERFVAFPGSETESAANGTIALDGSWTVDMVIPAGTFQSQDRNGTISSVDCTQVQCGVITIGAHGVKNANNETFTPVDFGSPTAAAAEGAAADGAAAAPAEAAAAGSARVGYTAASAVAGNALAFTGQGFSPSEQVVATLDEGVVAVGPLTAGTSGEVAGVLPLPADLRAGTHLLTLRGAASGAVAESELTVSAAASASIPTTVSATAEPIWPYLALGAAILIAAGLLIASLIVGMVRRGRRRKARTASASAASSASASASASPGGAPAAEPSPARAAGASATAAPFVVTPDQADTEVLPMATR
ncbi:hypothetical protein HQQ81_22195 [Microbacteriaceae bacterium VKM Ac-2854]|nr:hypothetical protein [Microbacteriaceae bacterium VKM Ac-2854]